MVTKMLATSHNQKPILQLQSKLTKLTRYNIIAI